MIRVVFVCLGNICRSPMAEGLFRHLVAEKKMESRFKIDSAGTGGWHAGEGPDPRSQSCMLSKGINISNLRARKFIEEDFEEFDHIICMDQSNMEHVLEMTYAPAQKKQVKKMLDFHPDPKKVDVPDPYTGGIEGFERVYEMLQVACQNLLDEVLKAK